MTIILIIIALALLPCAVVVLGYILLGILGILYMIYNAVTSVFGKTENEE